FTSANATTFTEGTASSFDVAASGIPAPVISLTGSLPTGVTFDALTGQLAGKPAGGTAGPYPLTFTPSNGVSPDAVQTFMLTVASLPGAPTITSASSTTFTVGHKGSFSVTTSGSPTPAVTESGTLPVGVNFDSTSDVLTGSPAAGSGGTYSIKFTA